MTNNERLNEWMKAEGLSDAQLGDLLHFDRAHVWRVRSGRRPITDGFRWMFARVFGDRVAVSVLGEAAEVVGEEADHV